MEPLDLDILLNHYAGISHIPVRIQPDAPETYEDTICLYYTGSLSVEEGSAGYTVTDEYVFCGKVVQKATGTIVLLGPVTEYALTADAIARITKQLGISRKEARGIQTFLQEIPLTTLSLFLKHLSFLNYLMNGKSDLLPQSIRATGKRLQKAQESEPVYHNTAQYENYLMRCIEHGQLELVQSALEEVSRIGLNMGKVSSTSLNALKNILISSTTLACRAAVQGGLDYDRAMSLSDVYIQQTEHIQTAADHYRLFTEMVTDFTRRTHDLRLCTNCSSLVRKVARDINGKLYQKISVEALARDHGVSSSYLSHRFHQETGKRLTDYIAEQKIDEAVRLMQTTGLTLAQISYQLSFSSQSYFHATFKKVTGMSPGKYPRRNSCARTKS